MARAECTQDRERALQSAGADRPYVCDFVSRSAKLVIEVDGGQHSWRTDADADRTRYLEANGFTVLRFWNNDVLTGLDGVVAEIERSLAALPSPDPSRKREGNA